MDKHRPLFGTSLVLLCVLGTISGWPVSFQNDDLDYPVFRPNVWNTDQEYSEDNSVPETPFIPAQNEVKLPRINFTPLDSGENVPSFKFEKPKTPVVKTRVAARTLHIATISDETPLYLNYADKEDPRHGPLLPSGSSKPAVIEKVTVAPVVQTAQEVTEDGPLNPDVDMDSENKKDDPMLMVLPDVEEDETETRIREDESPEIDFTQRLAFPDFSAVQPEELEEIPAEDSDDNEKINQPILVPEEPQEDPLVEEQDDSASTAAPEEEAVPELVKVNSPVIAPAHLNQQAELHYAPTNKLNFLLKAVGDKRAVESQEHLTNWSLTAPIIAGCVGAVIFGCVIAGIVYRRSHRKRQYLDDPEPSYGVTGPPVKPTFLDLSGDRSLSKSAETYHYQQQKQKILSSTENNPSSGSGSEPKSGDHSDYDTEDDDDEAEDYGDYTVYECPGLAPPGEIEIVNPMFSAQKKDDSAE